MGSPFSRAKVRAEMCEEQRGDLQPHWDWRMVRRKRGIKKLLSPFLISVQATV